MKDEIRKLQSVQTKNFTLTSFSCVEAFVSPFSKILFRFERFEYSYRYTDKAHNPGYVTTNGETGAFGKRDRDMYVDLCWFNSISYLILLTVVKPESFRGNGREDEEGVRIIFRSYIQYCIRRRDTHTFMPWNRIAVSVCRG